MAESKRNRRRHIPEDGDSERERHRRERDRRRHCREDDENSSDSDRNDRKRESERCSRVRDGRSRRDSRARESDEGERERETRKVNERRLQEESGMNMEVSAPNERVIHDDGKRNGGHGGSPKGSDSGREVNRVDRDWERRRMGEGRRSNRRASPADNDSESFGGDRRRRHRRDERGRERRRHGEDEDGRRDERERQGQAKRERKREGASDEGERERETSMDEEKSGMKMEVSAPNVRVNDDRKRNGGQRGSPEGSDSGREERRVDIDGERKRRVEGRRSHRRDERGMERRRHRGDEDEDDSSESDSRRKMDRRRRDMSGKEVKDLDNGGARSGREKIEREREVCESDGKLEEAVKPQREPTQVNANPGGDLATLGRTGGVYIPPFKLARMMKEVEDKSSVEYQRLTWDALRKSINGLVNKVNANNIKNIVPELFSENLIRGRGLFCRSCMKSQMASPGFTDVFAALVSVVNTKFPEIGDLLLRRIILQLKRAYKRNDKPQLIAAVKYIAHLVNQQVSHELVALELLTVLLEQPTDDSVEVAVDFVKESGSILQDLCPKGLHGIFERFRGILHEGEIDKRVQFLIEGLFAIRKAKFQGHPAVRPELDLVEPEDQLTHEVSLDDEIDPEISLDIFRPDPNFLENERRYEELKSSILGEESEDEDGSDAGSDDEEDEDDDDDEEEESQRMQIKDETETNLINLRRTIYLTIMSSVDFEEAGHKLLKIKLEPGQEMELCIMLLECCSQERTYLRYYGLLGQRFCMINRIHQENFEKCFVQQYSMIHRLETNKLRNVAKFFAHLLGTDALPWHVLAYIRLTEEDTTSSSRIFIKIIFQELSEHLGIRLLNERLNDPAMQDSFESIFPRDNPRNTRFSINFFTSIGLGGITENLREYLKNMPRMIMQQQKPESDDEPDPSGSGLSSSSSGSSSSETDSESSDDSDSSSDRHRKRRRRK